MLTCDTRGAGNITGTVNMNNQSAVEVIQEGEVGSPNSDVDDNKTSATNKSDHTPFKARWIVPLIKSEIETTPNMSYKLCKALIAPYLKDKFVTTSLLQNARQLARLEVFGNPDDNVQMVKAFLLELKVRNHDVMIVEKSAHEVYKLLERIILTEEVEKRKSAGKKMSKMEKINFIKDWKVKNMQMIIDAGMDPIVPTTITSSYVSGLYFSLSAARQTVPHLQQIFQADAAHMSFGKYTLYSCYGRNANGNTSCVGMGISFGNETKDDWDQFLQFIKSIHPSLVDYKNTMITDQGKGLIEAMKEVLPGIGHLHCSFHRRQNILKVVKGGSQLHSCLWLYNKLMMTTNVTQLEQLKIKEAPNVSDKALKYLNNIPDNSQYPAARCAMGEGIYMYNRSASSAVEAMNNANQRIREKTAVDAVMAMMLFVKMEGKRHEKHREKAWKCNDVLTPHGKKLSEEVFKSVEDHRLYHITVEDGNDRWVCRVVRTQMNERKCWFMKEPVMGSLFGGCTCGGPLTSGAPCHHMVAVVKSSRIDGLNMVNAMPMWYTTEMWRTQYPQNDHISYDLDMTSLRNTHTPDTTMRYCPPYIAPKKSGRPKKDKRVKSAIEGNQKKRKKALQTTWKIS